MFKFLVVDDEQFQTEYVSAELKGVFQNVTVTTAHSGNGAWKKILSEGDYDFIISDNNMPDGSGLELLARLIAARMQVCFILRTSDLSPDLPAGLGQWFLGVVTKLETAVLIDLISEHVKT